MKKSIWIFLLAVLLPGIVLGWLALRSAEEQQIIFERRTAELYQKETEELARKVRDAVEAERRAFGDTVHRLLAKSDAQALAKDFTHTLTDSWPRKAVGFVLGPDGRMLSPTTNMAGKDLGLRTFLWNNGSFLCSTQPAVVYPVPLETNTKAYGYGQTMRSRAGNSYYNGNKVGDDNNAYLMAKNAETAGIQNDNVPESGGKLAAIPVGGTRAGEGKLVAVPKEAASEPPENGLNQQTRTAAPAPAVAPAAPSSVGRAPVDEANARDGRREIADKIGHSKFKSEANSERKAQLLPAPGAAAKSAPKAEEIPQTTANPSTRAGAERQSEGLIQGKGVSETAAGDIFKDGAQKEDQSAAVRQSEAANFGGAVQLDAALQQNLGEEQSKLIAQQRTQSSISDFNGNAPVQNSAWSNRMVEPQQQALPVQQSNWSSVLSWTSDFRALTAGSDEGMLTRFVQDQLDLIFWIRPPEAPELVFGCLVEASDLEPLWKDLFANRVAQDDRWSSDRPPFVLALLNDKAHPAATFPAEINGKEWKRPFVANEIGEVLPHWEAALYLTTPTAVADSARGLRRTLSFTIASAIALIAIGGWLVVADVRRQLALAQQKTDFVSNVSHELKTPLTSIRMFAELMHDRPPTVEKQGQYLRIIRVEAERLTRLINNVLDFAKLERRQRRFEKKHLDLCDVITRIWEGHEIHLRDAGFTTKWEAAPGPYPILGDEDALSQILVNLLSNAEKYSNGTKEVELVSWVQNGWINVSVLDRGMGVPSGDEKKIFEAFYRAHDSLSSGIQGSGLGLTLAQRLATEQGGEIVFERRQGGGSRFTLRMPLVHGSLESEPAGVSELPTA